jgi:alpha-1,6-glucosidase-like protein
VLRGCSWAESGPANKIDSRCNADRASSRTSTWVPGLSPRQDNESKWDFMRPLLTDPALAPHESNIRTVHPIQAAGGDPVVRTVSYEPATGSFTVPARTVAVFVAR